MKQGTKDVIQTALKAFEQTTGLQAAYQERGLDKTKHPDGLVRIDHQNMQWLFDVQTKTKVTRTTAAIAKTEGMNLQQDRLVVTDYVTPPMADLMKKLGIFFMDKTHHLFLKNFLIEP